MGATMPRYVNLDHLQQFTAVNLLSDAGDIGGPVIIPSCAQISILWNLTDGKIGTNVLYGRYAGGFAGTVAQADAILAALKAGATWTALATFMPSTSAIFAVRIRNVAVEDQPVLQSAAAGANGTSPGTALPDEVAVVLTLRTAKTGASNRGRVYVPNWASNSVGAAGIIAAGAVTALGNWGASNLMAAINNNGYQLVIGQRARQAYTGMTGTQHPARAAGSEIVTSTVVRDNHFDSMRKRGLK